MTNEGVPRVIEVQKFAEARAPEIQSLTKALQASGNPKEWGAAAQPRHLRRRTTGHNSYRHRKRPNQKLLTKRKRSLDEKAEGEPNIAGRVGQQQKPTGGSDEYNGLVNRAMRRRPSRLQRAYQEQASSADLAAGPAPAVPLRLETHLWHAKRMRMLKRWSHCLADGVVGEGHGSKGLLHRLRAGAVVHDASYWGVLELRGPTAAVCGVLAAVSDPHVAHSTAASSAAQPPREWPLMLHHPSSYPAAAIGPARAMWLPTALKTHSESATLHRAAEQGAAGPFSQATGSARAVNTAASDLATGQSTTTDAGVSAGVPLDGMQMAPAAAVGVEAAPESAFGGQLEGDSRRLWLWVHAACAREAFLALEQACSGTTVAHSSRWSSFRRLEIRGNGADAVLRAALPLASQPGTSAAEALGTLKEGGAAAVLAADPRLVKPVGLGNGMGLGNEEGAGLQEGAGSVGQPVHPDMTGPDLAAAPPQPGSPAPPPPLWDCHRWPPPLPEAAVSSLRRRARLQSLHLPPAPDNPPATGAASEAESSAQPHARSCPAMIVRQGMAGSRGGCGWSVVLPPGWVLPFWLAAVYGGARAVGQQEWHWMSTSEGRAFFPDDFPDTAAYAELQRELQSQQAAAVAARPKSKAPQQLPHPPNWAAILDLAVGKAALSQHVAQGSGPPEGMGPDVMEEDPPSEREPMEADRETIPSEGGMGSGATQALEALKATVTVSSQGGGGSTKASAEQPRDGQGGPESEKTLPSSAAAGKTEGLEEEQPGVTAPHSVFTPGACVARYAAVLRTVLFGTPISSSRHPSQVSKRAPPLPKRRKLAAGSSAAELACSDCLVRVKLQMTGKGVAKEGASILMPSLPQAEGNAASCIEGPASKQGSMELPEAPEAGCKVAGKVIGFATSQCPRGSPKLSGSTALVSAKALYEAQSGTSPAAVAVSGSRKPKQLLQCCPVLVQNVNTTQTYEALASAYLSKQEKQDFGVL